MGMRLAPGLEGNRIREVIGSEVGEDRTGCADLSQTGTDIWILF